MIMIHGLWVRNSFCDEPLNSCVEKHNGKGEYSSSYYSKLRKLWNFMILGGHSLNGYLVCYMEIKMVPKDKTKYRTEISSIWDFKLPLSEPILCNNFGKKWYFRTKIRQLAKITGSKPYIDYIFPDGNVKSLDWDIIPTP